MQITVKAGVFPSYSIMEARSHYLSSASRLIRTTSPSTSAHLMSERIELDSLQEKKPKPDPVPCCLACGTILIPGLTSRKTTRSRRKPTKQPKEGLQTTKPTTSAQKKKDSASKGPLETVVVEECLACWRVVIHPLPAAAEARDRRVTERSQGVGGLGSVVAEQGGSRSRSRKKWPAGLLDRMKEEEEKAKAKAKADRGFDLMDFMRPV